MPPGQHLVRYYLVYGVCVGQGKHLAGVNLYTIFCLCTFEDSAGVTCKEKDNRCVFKKYLLRVERLIDTIDIIKFSVVLSRITIWRKSHEYPVVSLLFFYMVVRVFKG